MSNNQTPANVSTARAIGKGERLTKVAAAEIVAGLPEGFDPKARGAVTGAIHSWACGDSPRPKVAEGGKGEQTATDYGRGVDLLAKAVKALLAAEQETPAKAPELRVNMPGVGSVVVPKSDPFYPVALAWLKAAKAPALKSVA